MIEQIERKVKSVNQVTTRDAMVMGNGSSREMKTVQRRNARRKKRNGGQKALMSNSGG